MSSKVIPFFNLEDIDSLEVLKPIKTSSIAATKIPSPPPKSKPTSSRKRKSSTSTGVESSPFEDIVFHDAQAKLSQIFTQSQGQDHLQKAFEAVVGQVRESMATISNLRKISIAKEADLTRRMDKMEKELKEAKAEKEKVVSEKAKEMKEFRQTLISSAAATVAQARVKMALQAADPQFDRSEWDVEGLQARIMTLGGEPVVYPDPAQGDRIPEEPETTQDVEETAMKVAENVADGAKVGDEGGIEKA